MTGRRRNPVKTLFKVEHLEPNCVIIIKAGSAIDNDKNMKALANNLIQKGLGRITLLRLEKLEDFQVISEKQMKDLGWERIPLQVKEVANEPQSE